MNKFDEKEEGVVIKLNVKHIKYNNLKDQFEYKLQRELTLPEQALVRWIVEEYKSEQEKNC